MPRFRRFLASLVLAAMLAMPGRASGQESYAPAFVPVDHWSVAAARRMVALGLTSAGHDPTRQTLTQLEIAALLDEAAARAPAGSALERLAESYVARFADEFADYGDDFRWLAGSDIGAGYTVQNGRHATGSGYVDGHPYGDWTGAATVPDLSDPRAHLSVQVSGLDRLAVRAAVEYRDDDVELAEGYVTARPGSVVLWAGRRALGWGAGPGPGLVIGRGTFDAVGLHTLPFRLPWIFGRIGQLSVEGVVGRHDFAHSCHDPNQPGDAPPCEGAWLLATRGAVVPHPRLSLGVTRAAFFGGEGNTEVDAFAIFSVLIGKHAGEVSELDNQVVAVDVSFRPPTELYLPLRVYGEWGFEDSAGAHFSVPGILAGVEMPSLPALPGMALAVERTSFARSCCGNPIWYRHQVFHDGWTQDGRPLGHPLGGHGTEWTARVDWTTTDAGFRTGVELFQRERGDENLFAEAREGDSRGAAGRIGWWLHRNVEMSVRGYVEDGNGWRESGVDAGLRAVW